MNLSFLLVQSTGIIRKSFPFVPRSLLILVFFAGLGSLTKVQADGMFVAPKFVWDKHKDINEPTQKAILVFDNGREDLILQVKYEGPVSEFGWLIPVPGLPTVQKGSMKCFYELSKYTQEHFGEHGVGIPMSASLGKGEGEKPEPVKVIEVKTVGAYEVAVLSTKDAGALGKWLDSNHFYIPTNATGVMDDYVKRQWYFVAVKINLGKLLPGSFTTARKLASGELHPLQISFASDRCVFPLKISSVNGQPLEVQVYVLSPEPLLEKAMFEKKQAEVARLNVERESKLEQLRRNMQALHFRMLEAALVPSMDASNQLNSAPEVSPWEVMRYGTVTEKEITQCSKVIPCLKGKTWWLTKQTWTFAPAEMRDLEFQPAIPALAEKLDQPEGYFAAANLVPLGSNAVPVLLTALDGTNLTARRNAASVLDRLDDPRVFRQLDKLLKNSQPEVREQAIQATIYHWDPKLIEPLIGLLHDPYREIRSAAASSLDRHHDVLSACIPVFQQMLKDPAPATRLSGMKMLCQLGVPIPREALLQFFKLPDREGISLALDQLRNRNSSGGEVIQLGGIYENTGVSDAEAVPLLQNPDLIARMIGLRILYANAEKQSVELALPLLKDPEPMVRRRTAATLRALTGQHFTEDQSDQWEKWWNEHKATFVVELHPEALRPEWRGTNEIWWPTTNRPTASVP